MNAVLVSSANYTHYKNQHESAQCKWAGRRQPKVAGGHLLNIIHTQALKNKAQAKPQHQPKSYKADRTEAGNAHRVHNKEAMYQSNSANSLSMKRSVETFHKFQTHLLPYAGMTTTILRRYFDGQALGRHRLACQRVADCILGAWDPRDLDLMSL